MRIMTSKLHPNAQKVEEKLEKTTIIEAQKSGGPWFITTKGELGTLPGCAFHAQIIDCFREELDLVPSSEYFEVDSLEEFLVKTGMIRIRFDSDKADLTIRTSLTHSQITFLEKLPKMVSEIKCDFSYQKIIDRKPKLDFENFLSKVKKLAGDKNNEM